MQCSGTACIGGCSVQGHHVSVDAAFRDSAYRWMQCSGTSCIGGYSVQGQHASVDAAFRDSMYSCSYVLLLSLVCCMCRRTVTLKTVMWQHNEAATATWTFWLLAVWLGQETDKPAGLKCLQRRSTATLISGRICSEVMHVALQTCRLLCLGPAQNCCEKETILLASSCLSVRWYERDPIERTVIKLRFRDFLLRIVDTLGLL